MSLLLTSAEASRVGEAEIAQPVCTAVQIMLVDLLAECGGFRSAAGYFTACHAMWIAHYRGVYASPARSLNGLDVRSAMVAVGSLRQDLKERCSDDAFAGRLTVAASNSLVSVAVSGDEDAVAELEDVLEDEEEFHRRLKVDKAYHSNHIRPCYAPYVEALEKLRIEARRFHEIMHRRCHWFSSVDVSGKPVATDDVDMMQRLAATYGADNITSPVLFSQAVTAALEYESYALAVEVGPHPALRARVVETVRHVLEKKHLPYHGTLQRGKNAKQSIYFTKGFLWVRLREEFIDVSKFERSIHVLAAGSSKEKEQRSRKRTPRIVKELLTYLWNHFPIPHVVTAPLEAARAGLAEWPRGALDQPVFPAAGYVVTALEAALSSAGEAAGATARMVEMENFTINLYMPESTAVGMPELCASVQLQGVAFVPLGGPGGHEPDCLLYSKGH
ncbi:hypothetical protein QQS21_005350 [Conoideocrella luteorostrata]|uniref:Malonyl-CoA:ACP transacylase (MAT) domain-containing protein n=1 Tax=Conoideocrella luteorostrata TaxID=1105319 RepID=A0AAJ0CPJ2_9HYPO|nr:hypothetical protein QQS21_005350 [Conoideocrella luteorostrata]